MSQYNVERVIGRLITDEEFRGRFAENPRTVLEEITACGVELTGLELQVLASLDPDLTERYAQEIDPRIQKINLRGKAGCTQKPD